jgi:hypothetical protein
MLTAGCRDVVLRVLADFRAIEPGDRVEIPTEVGIGVIVEADRRTVRANDRIFATVVDSRYDESPHRVLKLELEPI